MTFIPHRPFVYGPHQWHCYRLDCDVMAIYRVTHGTRTDWWFYVCATHLEQAMRSQLSWRGDCLVSPAWSELTVDIVRSRSRLQYLYNPLANDGNWFPDDRPAGWGGSSQVLTITSAPTTVGVGANLYRSARSALHAVYRWLKRSH